MINSDLAMVYTSRLLMRYIKQFILLSKNCCQGKKSMKWCFDDIGAKRPRTQFRVCPKCHCTDGFTKAGFEHIKHTGGKRTSNPYATKQIYRCKSCGKRFLYDSGMMTHNLKITQEEFVEICKDAILCVPMKKTAARLNRSIQCVFENRHKFLCFLEKALGRKQRSWQEP